MLFNEYPQKKITFISFHSRESNTGKFHRLGRQIFQGSDFGAIF